MDSTTQETLEKIDTEIEAYNLVNEFFKHQQPEEISEQLSLMLETFIMHAPVSKEDMASAAFTVNKLTSFLFNLKEKSAKLLMILLPVISVLNMVLDFDF